MIRAAILTCVVSITLATASAQQTPPPEPQTTPSFSSPDLQAQFEHARQQAASGDWPGALASLKPLHLILPDDVDLTRFIVEAAIDAGDSAYALSQLKPLVDSKPGNWQELMLMARAYAEAHDAANRDAALTTLEDLHHFGRHAKLNAVQVFLVERVPLEKGHFDLYYSLVPWSRYNIFEMARVYNAAGQQVSRLTLESNDFEQAQWAKTHTQQAAQGMRFFSMDGYTEQISADGKHTQTHFTYGFFDGRPTYEAVRDKMAAIANGKVGPMSSTSGISISQ